MKKKSLKNCVITGMPIVGDQDIKACYNVDNSAYWYRLFINNEYVDIGIKEELMKSIELKDKNYEKIEKNRGLLIGYFLQDVKTRLDFKIICWEVKKKDENETGIKNLIEKLKTEANIPKTRDEKYNNMLVSLYNMLPTDESELGITNEIELYGKMFFGSFEEFQFYLKEALEVRKHLRYNDKPIIIQFRFSGLEYVEDIKKKKNTQIYSKESIL